MIDIYFNKPARPFNVDILTADMMRATNYLCIAAAWITNTQVAQAIIDSPAEHKYIVLNRADLKRDSVKASRMLIEFVEKMTDEEHWQYMNDADGNMRYACTIIGSESWQQGVMHHKFIICDSVVWTGSYNFTFQASKNYENLIRIDDQQVADTFLEEMQNLLQEAWLDAGYESNGAFRCKECQSVKPIDQMLGEPDSHGGTGICRSCSVKALA